MASITTPTKVPPQVQSHLLDVPDEELQRGRKRRRSSGTHTSSIGSTNLRGRGRRRSVSASNQIHHSSVPEELSESPERKSPGKKYAKKYLEVARMENKRRSQSPSRSRSLGRQGERKGTPRPRRRQRTRSRSRVHGEEERVEDVETELERASVDATEVAVED